MIRMMTDEEKMNKEMSTRRDGNRNEIIRSESPPASCHQQVQQITPRPTRASRLRETHVKSVVMLKINEAAQQRVINNHGFAIRRPPKTSASSASSVRNWIMDNRSYSDLFKADTDRRLPKSGQLSDTVIPRKMSAKLSNECVMSCRIPKPVPCRDQQDSHRKNSLRGRAPSMTRSSSSLLTTLTSIACDDGISSSATTQNRRRFKIAPYQPKRSSVKIFNERLNFSHVQSKVGSLANASHQPIGGNIKIKTEKLRFRETAKPKVDCGLIEIDNKHC